MNTPVAAHAIRLENRGIIALSGADVKTLLQGLITNDIGRLSKGRPIYAALLTPQGKYLHDFIIVQAGDAIFLDCEAERRTDLIRRLTMYRLRAQADIADRTGDLAVLAIIHVNNLPSHLPEDAIAYADPRDPRLGYRIILPASRGADLGLPLGRMPDYEELRLKLGIPDASRDFQVDKTLILEGNLEQLNGVDFNKGCYVGQELTARMKYRGKVRKRLLAVTIEGPAPAPDTPVFDGAKEIGVMRSSFGRIGIAFLRVEDLSRGASYRCGDATLAPQIPDWLKLDEVTN